MSNLKVIERGYNSQVVDILREKLAEAERGEIISVIISSECRDYYDTAYSGCDDLTKLLGHITRQAHIIQRRMDP